MRGSTIPIHFIAIDVRMKQKTLMLNMYLYCAVYYTNTNASQHITGFVHVQQHIQYTFILCDHYLNQYKFSFE